MKKVLILGAGPTGLVTGWELLKKGWDVTILEKDNIVGGLCRSWNYKNFILDTGPHIFHTPNKELKNFWIKNFGDLFSQDEYWCKNVKGTNFDEMYDYPLSIESIKNQFDKKLSIKIQKEIENLDKDKKKYATNYKDYIDSFIGPTLRKMFFEKYPKKIWGISTDQMTPDWAPSRIKFRIKSLPFYHEEWSAVGKYGTGKIYERIKENIIKLGGKVILNSEVIGLERSNKKITKIICKSKSYETETNIVISSLPLPISSYFLGYKSKLKYRGICSVYIFCKKKSILPKNVHWLYYDSEKIIFNRVTENKKLSNSLCPRNQSFITAEITYSKDDKINKMGKSKVINRVIDDLIKVNLVKKDEILDSQINFEPFVYPIQFKSFKEEVNKTKNYIQQFTNFYSIGAGGDFNYADSQVLFHKSFDLAGMLTDKYRKFYSEQKSELNVNLNNKVKTKDVKIGEANKTFIIAEIGLNHNGDIKIAKKLIDEAKKCGCDAVKFQSYKKEHRISKNFKSDKYFETVIGTEETISEMFNRLHLNHSQQKELFNYAKSKKILFFSSPFDTDNADFLENLGVKLYKIASMDLNNLPLIEHVAKKKLPIILSTGMSRLHEIDEAVETIKNSGNENLSILHCNSAYPSSHDEINLNFMKKLKNLYNIPIGYSDHSSSLLSSIVAISNGAQIIERHFTLNKNMEGPDHILSSDPEEMKKLVYYAREIPKILGDGNKKIQPNEYETLNSQRKSIFSFKKIKKGEKISKHNIIIKGPAGGISPKYLDIILGKKINKSIKEDQPIKWEDF